MKIEYDPAKSERNLRERGLSFERVYDFNFSTAQFRVDSRKHYGEIRHLGLGFLDGRLHLLCVTWRKGCLRVISLRKANRREVRDYEEGTYGTAH